ncbi:MAG TPA: hypothetical protein VLE89_02630, partial [Chlamydiales bacterium]|nr:hypothetical protein [Chlamydiales bacterium]
MEPVAKLQFQPKSALLPLDSVPAQIAYGPSDMSICAEREPAPKSSNLCKKASFATGSMEYSVLAYYCLVRIDDPAAEVARHQEFFRGRDFRGRIYISGEGINGQASGARAHAEEYMEWMRGDAR